MFKSNKIIISESSAYEFYKRYEEFQGRRFVINSAFQGNLDYNINKANIKLLRRKMISFGFEVLRCIGKYAENLADIECNVGFFPKDVEEQEVIRFLFYYGKWFNQNGFFYTDNDDIIWIISTREDSTFGGYGRKIRVKKFLKKNFISLISKFCTLNYVFDKVKVIAD